MKRGEGWGKKKNTGFVFLGLLIFFFSLWLYFVFDFFFDFVCVFRIFSGILWSLYLYFFSWVGRDEGWDGMNGWD